jgi:hypothetical protein
MGCVPGCHAPHLPSLPPFAAPQVWILTIQCFECLNVAAQTLCSSYLGEWVGPRLHFSIAALDQPLKDRGVTGSWVPCVQMFITQRAGCLSSCTLCMIASHTQALVTQPQRMPSFSASCSWVWVLARLWASSCSWPSTRLWGGSHGMQTWSTRWAGGQTGCACSLSVHGLASQPCIARGRCLHT